MIIDWMDGIMDSKLFVENARLLVQKAHRAKDASQKLRRLFLESPS